MSEIRDRVKEQLYDIIYGREHKPVHRWVCRRKIDQILSIPNLKVVDLEAELPQILVDPKLTRVEIVRQFKDILRKEGWVREIKED